MANSLPGAKRKFSRLNTEWVRAERECREAYVAWQVANQRRMDVAMKRNNAYGELELARASEQNEATRAKT